MPKLDSSVLLMAALVSPNAFSATEILLEQQLGGVAQQSLKALAARFNASQGDYKVAVVDRQLESKSHMALLSSAEGARLMEHPAEYKPLHQVMAQAGERFEAGSFSAALASSVNDAAGKPSALPVAYSAPVMYYNRAVLRKVGLNPDKPPKTWIELQEAAGAMYDAGVACPYTSSYPAWVHVENASSLNSETYASGSGGGTRVSFNALAQVRHLAMMTSWVKGRYFQVFGRGAEADQRFAKGECAVITSASSSYPDFRRSGAVDVGVAPIPMHDDGHSARSALPDGSALWVLEGKSPAEYKGVARFVSFLLQPRTQADWVASTGFLPVTRSVSVASDGEAGPAAVLAMREMAGAKPLPLSAQLRVRNVVNEELESVWSNLKPPKEGLDVAVLRANQILSSGVMMAAAPVSAVAAVAASKAIPKAAAAAHHPPASKKRK